MKIKLKKVGGVWLGRESKSEKVGFEGGFEHGKGGGFFYVRWEWVPEGGSCNGECPVTPGAFFGFVGEF